MTFAIQTLFFTYLNKISENQFAVASEWVFSALLLTCSMAVGQLSLPVSLWSHCIFARDAGLYIYMHANTHTPTTDTRNILIGLGNEGKIAIGCSRMEHVD